MGTASNSLALVIVALFLTSLIMVSVPLIKSQPVGNIVINSDGSVAGTNSIQQVGNIYTLTENISGNIQVQKSNIILNGSGFALDGKGTGGIDLTNNIQHDYNNPAITNITIENMYLKDGGIGTNGGGNNTFYNDFFSNCSRSQGGFAIQLLGCSYNNISYCNFDDESIVGMDYSANFNIVTNCNLPSNAGILIWLSGSETVDKNYWSDYSSKYPNATEVDHSGVGNTPYVFLTLPNGAQPAVFQDNHPLMKPVTIPLMSSNPQTTVPEFSWLAILPLLFSMLFIAVILRQRKPIYIKQ